MREPIMDKTFKQVFFSIKSNYPDAFSYIMKYQNSNNLDENKQLEQLFKIYEELKQVNLTYEDFFKLCLYNFNAYTLFGDIIVIDEKTGTELGRYEYCNIDPNIFSNGTMPLFAFSKVPIETSRSKQYFYGVRFLPIYDQHSFKYIAVSVINWYFRKTKILRKDNATRKETIFHLGEVIMYRAFYNHNNRDNKFHRFCFYNRIQSDELKNAYNEAKKVLAACCSSDTRNLLYNATDLTIYKGCIGIYILYFDEVNGIYVGQASSDLQARILSHFKMPNSDFDLYYGHNDVSSISIIRCPTKYLDALESEIITIIASVKKEVLLNCLIGGCTITQISDNKYVPRCTTKTIEKLINDSKGK